MNMQTLAVINGRQHEVTGRTAKTLTLGSGKTYACYWLASRKLVSKNVITGAFRAQKIK